MSKGKVIILHGLESNSKVMAPMARILAKAGYEVFNSTYHCGRRTWQEVAEDVRNEINGIVKEGEIVHFVCHSLGGILVRHCIQEGLICYVGRVVTIGSPHEGAFWVDDIPFGRELGYAMFGPKMVDSLTDVDSVKSLDGLEQYKVLCITTDKPKTVANPLSWIAGKYIKGASDGFVPKQGMVLNHAHTVNFHCDHLWAVWDRQLIKCVVNFLNYGKP